MKEMYINREIFEKIQQEFINVKGLIGKIYDKNFQIVGFYTSSRNKNNVFITLTKSFSPCHTKNEIETLKFLSESRIVKIASKSEENIMKKHVDYVISDLNNLSNFIYELDNKITNCNNELLNFVVNYSSTVDIDYCMKKYNYKIGYICKFKNFLTRVKNYYGPDCKYYFTFSEEF